MEKRSFDKLRTSGEGGVCVARKALNAIQSHTATTHPEEACGLLLGTNGRITQAVPARNVHPTPRTHFEIDPQALIDAHRAERQGGLEVLGYFHSHPTGEPEPSTTDRALSAGEGKVWAIAAGGGVRFWRDDPQGFRPLSYEPVAG